MLAPNKRRTEIVKMLLRAGANVNAESDEGWTALMGAALWGKLNVAKQLIAAGARVNVRVTSGQFVGATPLYLAISNRFPAIVKVLKAAGATE